MIIQASYGWLKKKWKQGMWMWAAASLHTPPIILPTLQRIFRLWWIWHFTTSCTARRKSWRRCTKPWRGRPTNRRNINEDICHHFGIKCPWHHFLTRWTEGHYGLLCLACCLCNWDGWMENVNTCKYPINTEDRERWKQCKVQRWQRLLNHQGVKLELLEIIGKSWLNLFPSMIV